MSRRYSQADIVALFREYTGDADPDDPKERKRDRIVRAATEHFIRHGYRKASMEDIARDAGVAKGTLYLYFKTKGELVLRAIVEEKRRYADTIVPLFADDIPPRERLLGLLRAGLVLATQMPLASKLLSGDREMAAALEDLPPEVRQRAEVDHRAFMAALVREAAPPDLSPDEIEDRAKVVLGLTLFGGLLGAPHVRHGLSVERFAEILAQLIVDGLTHKGGGR